MTLHDEDSVTIGIKLDDAEIRLREISPSEIYVMAYVKNTEGDFYKTSKLPDAMVDRKMAGRSWSLIKQK